MWWRNELWVIYLKGVCTNWKGWTACQKGCWELNRPFPPLLTCRWVMFLWIRETFPENSESVYLYYWGFASSLSAKIANNSHFRPNRKEQLKDREIQNSIHTPSPDLFQKFFSSGHWFSLFNEGERWESCEAIIKLPFTVLIKAEINKAYSKDDIEREGNCCKKSVK